MLYVKRNDLEVFLKENEKPDIKRDHALIQQTTLKVRSKIKS